MKLLIILIFFVLTKDVWSKVSARDIWWTRPALFAMTLTKLSQQAFLFIPLWKGLSHSPTRGSALQATFSNLNIYVYSKFTWNMFTIYVIIRYHFFCKYNFILFWCKILMTCIGSSKAWPSPYSHFCYYLGGGGWSKRMNVGF